MVGVFLTQQLCIKQGDKHGYEQCSAGLKLYSKNRCHKRQDSFYQEGKIRELTKEFIQ
jgi:hypothetical protein